MTVSVPLRAIAAIVLLATMASHAAAPDAFPTKPVRFIVGYAPGGGADVLTRLIARQELPPRGVPTLPDPAPPVQRDDYWSARELIASAGVPFVAARAVRSVDEAFAAATAIGYPVVLKALGSAHKSDSGGVVVGIRDEDALERSFTELQCRLETRRARHLYSIERMARLETGVELVIGARWDHRFGPIALVGMGGVFTELLRDVAVALAPLDEEQAVGLIGSLRGAPLLKGYRGRQAVDVSAAARALVDLSALAAAHPDIAEMEVNPLLVSNEGALGLDARVILHGNEEGDGDA